MTQIGPIRFAGLLVAPILGSGIVLLPPIISSLLGEWSVVAWVATVLYGLALALVFTRLGIQIPNAGGIAQAAKTILGERWATVASLSIVCAAMIGPVVVMRTGAEFIVQVMPGFDLHYVTLGLLVIGHAIVAMGLRVLSGLSLFLSISTVIVLVVGASLTLGAPQSPPPVANATPGVPVFAQAFLLLFWSVIGWDIILHFSGDLKGRKKTMILGIGLGSIVVSVVMLLIARAVQIIARSRGGDVSNASYDASLIMQLVDFGGPSAAIVLAALVVALTLSTFLMVVGAVTRLLVWLIQEQSKNKGGRSFPVQIVIVIAHCVTWWVLAHTDVTLAAAIGIANVLFITNIVVGLAACWYGFTEFWFRLVTAFCGIVCFCVAFVAQPFLSLAVCAICALYLKLGIIKSASR